MNVRDLLLDALDSLLARRARSILCALGFLTGVAAVVVACAVANGAERQALADIGALGIDNVIVEARPQGPRAPALSLDDVEALQREMPDDTVAAWRSVADTSNGAAVTVAGVTASWRRTAGIVLASGRWFAPAEAARTAVVGVQSARERFGTATPIGRLVLAAGEWRTIVGVIRAGSAGASADLARSVLVSFTTLDMPLGTGDDGRAAGRIVIRASAGEDVTDLARRVRHRLLQRHEATTFEIVVPRELMRARLRSQRTFRAVLFAVGGLSLLVGGIGVANVMLSAVMERAGEIGVRRAVGARRSTIMRQFALEAALLGLAGGLSGVLAGAAGAAGIAALAHWPVALTPGAAGGACAAAAAAGLTAGLYPARAAARVTPIDALRQ